MSVEQGASITTVTKYATQNEITKNAMKSNICKKKKSMYKSKSYHVKIPK